MRVLLVHNPTAGGGRARRVVPEVAARLAADGVEVDQYQTLSLTDGRLAACDAAGAFDAVVAVGGDGTVGACAAGLADAGPGGGPRSGWSRAVGATTPPAASGSRPATRWPRPRCCPGCGGGRPTWPVWPAGPM